MANVRIVMKDGRQLSELTDREQADLYTAFVMAYVEELEKELQAKPDEYRWPDKSHDEVCRVVSKMVAAIYHGRANNSNPLRRAAKRLGLNGSMCYTEALVRGTFAAVARVQSQSDQSVSVS